MVLNSLAPRSPSASNVPRFGLTWCVLMLFVAACGCSDSLDAPTVERVSVEGWVTLDGRPLKAGAIVFHGPVGSVDAAEITAHALIKDGKYQIDVADGPAVGVSRVEVRPKPLAREEYEATLDAAAKSRNRRVPSPTVVDVPAKYGQESELRAELVSGTPNHHDFKLDSRS